MRRRPRATLSGSSKVRMGLRPSTLGPFQPSSPGRAAFPVLLSRRGHASRRNSAAGLVEPATVGAAALFAVARRIGFAEPALDDLQPRALHALFALRGLPRDFCVQTVDSELQ